MLNSNFFKKSLFSAEFEIKHVILNCTSNKSQKTKKHPYVHTQYEVFGVFYRNVQGFLFYITVKDLDEHPSN